MYKRLFTATIIFGAAALAPPVLAESTLNCLERSKLIAVLQETYNEQPTGAGLQSPQQMLEIWTSPESGSFTVMITFANGTSCVVASGSSWQDIAPTHPEGTAG